MQAALKGAADALLITMRQHNAGREKLMRLRHFRSCDYTEQNAEKKRVCLQVCVWFVERDRVMKIIATISLMFCRVYRETHQYWIGYVLYNWEKLHRTFETTFLFRNE